MCVQNLKFVALPVPEIIGFTKKIWAAPGYAHAPFFPKILKGFCSDGPFEYTYLPNLKCVALRAPEIIWGTQKIWEVPGYAHALFFSQIFKGLLFGWTLCIYLSNLKFVALPIPEIIGGTQKKFGPSLDTPTLPLLQNFSWACVRMDPLNIPAKFEVPSFSRS